MAVWNPRIFKAQNQISVEELFVPPYYAHLASLQKLSSSELLSHFLSQDLTDIVPPSPLVRIRKGRAGFGRKVAYEPFLWRFDPAFYEQTYPDARETNLSAFAHYVQIGLGEDRRPNAFFDPVWYNKNAERRPGEEGLPSYIHYLTFGAPRGEAPSRLLLPAFMHRGSVDENGLARYDRLVEAAVPWQRRLGDWKVDWLFALFMSYTYNGNGALNAEAGGVERLVHFLERGLDQGLSPGPLFDEQQYARNRSEKKARLIDFIKNGAARRIVPNTVFDSDRYLAINDHLVGDSLWEFEHFVRYGIFEGRKIDWTSRMSLSSQEKQPTEIDNWRDFYATHFRSCPPPGHGTVGEAEMRAETRVEKIIATDLFHDLIEQARALDPSIGDISQNLILQPPSYDGREILRQQILERLPARRYDTIICVPWLRPGGADLVACLLSETVRDVTEKNVLILRVDYSAFERPDWVPDRVDCVHVSDLLSQCSSAEAETLLYTIFIGLNPRRIVNVNSLRTWQTFVRFGLRLCTRASLYAYMFCWDQTKEGLRVGYPSRFFPATAAFLSGTFTDSVFLRNELLKIYTVPAAVAKRLVPLFSPARSPPLARPLARTSSIGTRPKVLWAGRLDRQKRFDLVRELAVLMPDVDFECWGAALLDAPKSEAQPSNLTLHDPFMSYDDLPLAEADIWLFTSAWEGMPTILIEIAMRGMVLVGSMVGGVPELLTEQTGYPVYDVGNAAAYVEAIRDALANPVSRVARAAALQTLASSRYTKAAYREQICTILEAET